jgi:hypothetical protein
VGGEESAPLTAHNFPNIRYPIRMSTQLILSTRDHADAISALNWDAINGLPYQRGLHRPTSQASITQAEVEHEIQIAIEVHILYMTKWFSSFLIHVNLAGAFKGYCRCDQQSLRRSLQLSTLRQ